MLIKKYLERSMSFGEYRVLIEHLVAGNRTTGPRQTEHLAHFTRLNLQRMNRLEKTTQLDENLMSEVSAVDERQTWLVITEAWCGDAAQNIPIIEKIASKNAIIETRYILRDENPELMNRFLTFGVRSIPKLIAIDVKSFEVLWTWGARLKPAQDLFFELRKAGIEKPEILERIQRWYNEDKGVSVQREIVSLSGERKIAAESA